MSPTARPLTRRTVISSALIAAAGVRFGLLRAAALQQLTWTEDQQIPGKSSRTSPALSAVNDQLHLVHKGENSTALWHSWWTASANWSEDQAIANHASNALRATREPAAGHRAIPNHLQRARLIMLTASLGNPLRTVLMQVR